MQISDLPPLLLPLKSAPGKDHQQFLASLRSGQALQALVTARNENNFVTLKIGSHQLLAKTQLQLEQGQRLALQVTRTAGGTPELRLMQPASPNQLKVQALKSALPNQVNLAQLFDQLSVESNIQLFKTVPQLDQVIRKLLAGVMSADNPKLTEEVQRAIGRSGLFMESLLMTGNRPDADLKADLLRLLHLLKLQTPSTGGHTGTEHSKPEQLMSEPTRAEAFARSDPMLGELTRTVSGAIARLQVNQLASLPDEHRHVQVWQLDIPVATDQGIDLFRINIERNHHPSGEEGAIPDWCVTLRMELKELGPIQAQLKLIRERHINASFWVEHPGTCDRIQRALPRLKQTLQNAGLEIQGMLVHQGLPEQPLPLTPPTPLLDEKA